MKVVLFCHSILSDWNHGNAHFLRGVAVELQSRGHKVEICEPRSSWSAANLVADHGADALMATLQRYPTLSVTRYDEPADVGPMLDGADVVIVHEWNPPELVAQLGRYDLSTRRFVLLFHDTHHRAVSEPGGMSQYCLEHYDGVLAFGEVLRERYLAQGWATRAWTWHEAADTRIFAPRPGIPRDGDVVWVGNWGDDERSSELREFLIEPVARVRCRATVHGVRYPQHAIDAFAQAGFSVSGWLPNYRVPEEFARHRVTVHVPRRPYAECLRGIPTIRPFEALACGIPLVSAPWSDDEQLFRAGLDYLPAADGAAMTSQLAAVLHDDDLARALADSGRERVLARHTCAHRVDELLQILSALGRRSDKPVAHLSRSLATDATMEVMP